MSFTFQSLVVDTGFAVVGHNEVDPQGNPAGGYASQSVKTPVRANFPDVEAFRVAKAAFKRQRGEAFCIYWQDGPIDRAAGEAPNGALVEDILEVCARRIEFYQESPYRCDTNDRAIQHIRGALEELLERRDDRAARGVLGKHEV